MTRKEEIRNLCNAEAVKVAQKVGAAAWYEQADKFLTDEEKGEIKAIWETMPGNSCWNDAFRKWMS